MASFPDYFKDRKSPKLESNSPVIGSDSRGLKTKVRRIPAQRWEITLNGFVYQDEFKKFSAFLFGLNGPFNAFDYFLRDYGKSKQADDVCLTPVNSGKSKVTTGTTLKQVEAGDLFQFEGHSKIYQVQNYAEDAKLLDFFPSAVRPVSVSEKIIFQNPKFKMRIKSSITGGSASSVRHPIEYNFKLIEAI